MYLHEKAIEMIDKQRMSLLEVFDLAYNLRERNDK